MPEYQYICNDCGEEFDEPGVHVEPHPEVGWGEERWAVCPYCGSEDFTEQEEEEEEEYLWEDNED